MASSFTFIKNQDWLKKVILGAFGKSFWGFLAAAFGFGVLCWAIKGPDAVAAALSEDFNLLLGLMPRVFVALTIAALIWVMMPRELMTTLVGSNSGMRGLVIAAVAGTVTPGGPASAYPLLAAAGASGADRGALVAYITAWATLGLQRILIWDVPFMGAEFAMLRFAVCLPLPIIAGLIARRLRLELRIKEPNA